jgi:hypothetical protein
MASSPMTTLNNLGVLHSDTGRNADAEKDYTEALAIYRELAVNNPNVYDSRVAFLIKSLICDETTWHKFLDICA